MKSKISLLLVLLFLTLFAMLILPSEYYTEDMVLQIPFISFLAKPKLYTNDYLQKYGATSTQLSFYYLLVAGLVKFLPLDLFNLLRILHGVYLFILFSVLYKFSHFIGLSHFAYILFIIFLISHLHVGGSGITLIESEFIPRGLGLIVLLYTAVLIFEKRFKTSFVLATLSFLIHGTTSIFGFLVGAVAFILNKYKKRMVWGVIVLIGGYGIGSLFLWLYVPRLDLDWLKILRLRNSYAFIDTWTFRSWINLLILLLPGAICLWLSKTPQRLKDLIQCSYIGGLIALSIQILFTSVKPIFPITILQLGRLWIIPVYISLVSLAYMIANLVKKNLTRIVVIITVGLLVICINKRSSVLAQTSHLSEWLEIQKWAQENTATNCVFLVPFFTKGFRVESQRAIVGEYKDGTLSFYSRDFASEWEKRRIDLSSWQQNNDAYIQKLHQKYLFHYIVDKKDNLRSFPIVFESKSYRVYSLIKC